MPLRLTELFAGLPFALSFAGVGSVALLSSGRRRVALNEALHELRRPMQALQLALPPEVAEASAVDSSLRLASAALDRLDREINGEAGRPAAAPVPLRPLAEAAAQRWRPRAAAAGRGVHLDWGAPGATVRGDRVRLEQALDNLIINGLEHGHGDLTVEGRREGSAAAIAVRDGGGCGRAGGRLAAAVARLRPAGDARRGHGLRVVRRTAAAHGGRFRLLFTERGTEALLELPASPQLREARRGG